MLRPRKCLHIISYTEEIKSGNSLPELLDISVFDGSSSLNIRMDMLVDANMQQQ